MTANAKVASSRPHPPAPHVTNTMIPMTAPQIAPGIVTVRAPYPAAATATFTATASGRSRHAFAAAAAARSLLMRDVVQRMALAIVGTEMLSSSLIGIVSTAAAPSAATHGIPMENHRYAGGITVDRHHQQSNEPAAPPKRTNASAAGDGLVTVPGNARAGDVTSCKGRHPVAEREHAPGCGDDVAAVRKRKDEKQNATGVQTRCRRETAAEFPPDDTRCPASLGSAYRLKATAPAARIVA